MNFIKKHIRKIIIATIVLAILSCVYDYIINGNFVAMLSGLWSAASTIALGLLAFYQNKKYKDLSDQYQKTVDELALKPEVFIDEMEIDTYHSIDSLKGKYVPLDMRVHVCKFPVVHFHTYMFQLFDENGNILYNSIDGENGIPFKRVNNFYVGEFKYRILLPYDITGKMSCNIEFHYSDIYSNQYSKQIIAAISGSKVNPTVNQFDVEPEPTQFKAEKIKVNKEDTSNGQNGNANP